ncbi:MAG: SH3 domain-containing protein [Lachnospiraceae bacterium]|nr:SH3 domain-containing protein [Lachnospiraceae bacterium]
MNVSKRPFKYLIGILAAFCFAFLAIVFGGKAIAADGQDKPTPTPIQDYVNKEQYLNGYYRGTVTSNTATVRTGPGTKAYPELKTSDGTVVKLTKGTEVFVWGETKDVDLDVWYHITATFNNEQIEGYIYIGRVTRDNTQILFTPTPTPVPPTPTPIPTITETVTEVTPTLLEPTKPDTPENVKEISEKSKDNKPMYIVLIICCVIVVLIIAYSLFQRAQEKKLEEEMERYTKRRPAMERLDGEDEDDFNEAKKKYYASMDFGHGEKKNARPSRPAAPVAPIEDEDEDDFADDLKDDVDEDDIKLSTPKKKEDIYDEDEFTDDDVKVVDDFRDNGNKKKSAAKSVTEDNLDFSDDDLEYFERLKGNLDSPSEKAIASAGTAASILDESPEVDSYFEEEHTSEERLKIKLNALRPQDRFVHKLYGEGVVVENSDPDIIQVRFGRDLRFLKKEKLARKELVEL